MTEGIFVTGTDTGVGKTLVATAGATRNAKGSKLAGARALPKPAAAVIGWQYGRWPSLQKGSATPFGCGTF